jgi:hypothetical protein
MEHNYRPNFDKLLQGQSNLISDEQIVTAVRKIMIADKLAHAEAVDPTANTFWASKKISGKRTIRNALASRLVSPFRRKAAA